MAVAFNLTSELREKLKKPIGTLIRGSFAETIKRFKEMIGREKPSIIISVGDTISRNLIENGIPLQLLIIDNKAMRKNTQKIPSTEHKIVQVKNPAGIITEEACTAIEEALRNSQQVKIIVDGEEDLLTLITVLYAPENALVVYGQPYEGIVVVKVTPEKKMEISGILKAMESARKAK